MSDTEARIREIFEQMPQQLNPQAAQGLDCVIQYDLGGDGGKTFHAAIRDGNCVMGEGAHDAPSMTLKMAAADFVALTSGELDPMGAFMSGKLRVSGDMGLAMKMQSLFRSA